MVWIGTGVLFAGFLWRLARYFLNLPIWGDEAMLAISLLTRDFSGMVHPLEYGQIAPVGFMWAELAVVRLLGISEWSLRMMPFAASLLSLLIFWRFAFEILDRRSALLATAIFASAYYVVRHGAEIKPYSTDLFVALVLTYLGWRLFRRPDSTIRWAALILAGTVSVWVSYPAAFVAGGVGLLLTYLVYHNRSRKAAAWWVLYGVCVAASFAGMLLLVGQAQAQASSWLVDHPAWRGAFAPLHEPWRIPLWLLDMHTGNMMAYPIGGKRGGSAVTLLLVLAGSIVLWRRRRPLLLLLLSPLILALAASVLKRYPYGGSARIALYMAPAFCLLAGVGLAWLLRRFLRGKRNVRAVAVATAVVGLISVIGVVADVAHPYKSYWDSETRRVLTWLREQTAPDDRWVIFNAITRVPHSPNLQWYSGAGARFRYYVARCAPVPTLWGPPSDQVSRAAPGRNWLIVYHHHEIPIPPQLLPSYLHSLTERLGSPKAHAFSLGRGPERIEIYEFSASR